MVDVSKNKSKEEDIGAKDPTIKSAMDESEQVIKIENMHKWFYERTFGYL